MTPAADGFEYPMTVQQQLMRLNRIAILLWERRSILEDGMVRGRVAVDVTPDLSHVQITVWAHAPAELSDAASLADSLGLDPDKQTRHGRTLQHYWVGELGGFKTQLCWLERDHSRDTQGRAPLPAGVGVGDRVADRFYRSAQPEADQAQAGVRLALGDVPPVGPKWAPRPAEADMPPAPVPAHGEPGHEGNPGTCAGCHAEEFGETTPHGATEHDPMCMQAHNSAKSRCSR
jgi:hypothetical protein